MIAKVILALFIIGYFRNIVYRFLRSLVKQSYTTLHWSFSKMKSEGKIRKDIQMDERSEDIEIQIDCFLSELKRNLNKMEQIESIKKVVHQNKDKIDRNEDFTFTIELQGEVTAKHYLHAHTFITTCLICNFPCHKPCTILKDDWLYDCTAMEKKGDSTNAKCLKCPRNCSWRQHRKLRYFVSTDFEKFSISIKSSELLSKYQNSESEMVHASDIIELMCEEYEASTLIVIGLIEVLRKNLTQLDGIAPNTFKYIDNLIIIESSSAESGWEQRVQRLHEVKDMVEFLAEKNKRGQTTIELYKHKIEDRKIKIWSEVVRYLKIIDSSY